MKKRRKWTAEERRRNDAATLATIKFQERVSMLLKRAREMTECGEYGCALVDVTDAAQRLAAEQLNADADETGMFYLRPADDEKERDDRDGGARG